ncbi:MAG: hypothetical protein QM530_09735 [Phycisphaerales bacterium]|nr:hypothetical protein [Phycisphaerales bacterium]
MAESHLKNEPTDEKDEAGSPKFGKVLTTSNTPLLNYPRSSIELFGIITLRSLRKLYATRKAQRKMLTLTVYFGYAQYKLQRMLIEKIKVEKQKIPLHKMKRNFSFLVRKNF